MQTQPYISFLFIPDIEDLLSYDYVTKGDDRGQKSRYNTLWSHSEDINTLNHQDGDCCELIPIFVPNVQLHNEYCGQSDEKYCTEITSATTVKDKTHPVCTGRVL